MYASVAEVLSAEADIQGKCHLTPPESDESCWPSDAE